MATKPRSRARRLNSSRDRAPRYVAPVLDPSWQNPYIPFAAERHANLAAVRRFAIRRKVPTTIVVAVVVLAMLASFLVSVWLPVAGVVIAGLYAWDLFRSLKKTEHEGSALASAMLARFIVGGTTQDRQRLVTVLDRLAATFGVDGVSAFIIEDLVYNAALVPDGDRYSLFVTSALMGDLELIELEGVIAHCLARQRLGLLTRESLACVAPASDVTRRALVGTGTAYRADEVAAAAIRYPLGLAGALHKCARQVPAPGSFFSSADYASWRWIWFDRWSDRPGTDLSDLDDVELRALALEEW